MTTKEVRDRLAVLKEDHLRLVAAQLYKMLPRKVAVEKRADELLADPAGFLQAGKVRKPGELPDSEMVCLETGEFLENAAHGRYFAPNRIISKAQRSKWRFVAKRIYQNWCLLAALPEHRAAAAGALESLYRTLCRATQVYLFPSTEPFQVIKVPQHEFFEQLFLIKSQIFPVDDWISHAVSLLVGIPSGEFTSAKMHAAFVALLKTPELKESALRVVTSQLGNRSEAPRKKEFFDPSSKKYQLLRIGFMTAWSLGEKDRAVQWLRSFAAGERGADDLVFRFLFETRDCNYWMSAFEAAKLRDASALEAWEPTYNHAKLSGALPSWQAR